MLSPPYEYKCHVLYFLKNYSICVHTPPACIYSITLAPSIKTHDIWVKTFNKNKWKFHVIISSYKKTHTKFLHFKNSPTCYGTTPDFISSNIHAPWLKTHNQGLNTQNGYHWNFHVIKTSDKKVTNILFYEKISYFLPHTPACILSTIHASKIKTGIQGQKILQNIQWRSNELIPSNKKVTPYFSFSKNFLFPTARSLLVSCKKYMPQG